MKESKMEEQKLLEALKLLHSNLSGSADDFTKQNARDYNNLMNLIEDCINDPENNPLSLEQLEEIKGKMSSYDLNKTYNYMSLTIEENITLDLYQRDKISEPMERSSQTSTPSESKDKVRELLTNINTNIDYIVENYLVTTVDPSDEDYNYYQAVGLKKVQDFASIKDLQKQYQEILSKTKDPLQIEIMREGLSEVNEAIRAESTEYALRTMQETLDTLQNPSDEKKVRILKVKSKSLIAGIRDDIQTIGDAFNVYIERMEELMAERKELEKKLEIYLNIHAPTTRARMASIVTLRQDINKLENEIYSIKTEIGPQTKDIAKVAHLVDECEKTLAKSNHVYHIRKMNDKLKEAKGQLKLDDNYDPQSAITILQMALDQAPKSEEKVNISAEKTTGLKSVPYAKYIGSLLQRNANTALQDLKDQFKSIDSKIKEGSLKLNKEDKKSYAGLKSEFRNKNSVKEGLQDDEYRSIIQQLAPKLQEVKSYLEKGEQVLSKKIIPPIFKSIQQKKSEKINKQFDQLEKRAGDDQTLKDDINKTREWARNTKGIKSTELKDAIAKLEERVTPPAQDRSSKKGG